MFENTEVLMGHLIEADRHYYSVRNGASEK